jgi:hypothetical protein
VSVGCNDDFAGPAQRYSQVSFAVTAGTLYKIRVSSYSSSATSQALAGPFQVTVSLCSPPANDNLAAAATIGSLPFTTTRDTTCATVEGGEPVPSCVTTFSKTAWWTLTPASSGTLIVASAGSSFTNVLDLRTGSGFGTSAGCATATSATLSVPVTGGTTYLLRGGTSTSTGVGGNLALSVSLCIPPVNDNVAAALSVAAPFSDTKSTTCATLEAGETAPACGSSVGKTIWYTFVPTASGTMTADTFTSSFDTVLDVRTGSGFGTSAACNDDSGGLQSNLSLSVTAGTAYAIRVGGYSGASGTAVLHVSCSPYDCVADITPPTIDPMADVTTEATGPDGADVSYDPPATTDDRDAPGVATCDPGSGAFALGDTTVMCTASDSSGNAATPVSFTVHVVDTTAPTIDAHGDMVAEATGPDGAAVDTLPPATHDIVDGDGVATCDPASGSTFALGDTLVTCTATDAAGNDAESVSFAVIVLDTTAPAIDALPDLDVEADSPAGATVTYDAPATHDAVDGDGVATCEPTSGSQFPIGTTTVTCSATDANGNSASTSFAVTVALHATGTVGAEQAQYTLAEALLGGVRVTYHVAAGNGQGVAGVSVHVSIVGGLLGLSQELDGTTDASGDFSANVDLTLLLPGTYALHGEVTQAGYPTAPADGAYEVVAGAAAAQLPYAPHRDLGLI